MVRSEEIAISLRPFNEPHQLVAGPDDAEGIIDRLAGGGVVGAEDASREVEGPLPPLRHVLDMPDDETTLIPDRRSRHTRLHGDEGRRLSHE